MTSRLDKTVGTFEYDGLILDGSPRPDVFHVTVSALSAETTLRRGTVLALKEDGKMEVLGSGDAVANCVVSDDTDVGTADTLVAAYRTGSLNRNKLIVAEGYELSAQDEEYLRQGGILLNTAV